MNELKYANDNIRLLLKYNDWTQTILSKKTGISEVTLRRRLNSEIPKWTMLEAVTIAKVFKEDVTNIFFNRMVPKSNKDKEE